MGQDTRQFLTDAGMPRLSAVVDEAMDSVTTELQAVQTLVNFPVLYMGSLMLRDRNIQGSILMSSRDCYLWKILLDKMGIEATYFYTSRLARKAGQHPRGTVVDLVGSGASGSLLPVPVIYMVQWGGKRFQNVSALYEGDAPEMERANPAPHDMAVTSNTFQRFCIDWANDSMTQEQVQAFRHVVELFHSAEEFVPQDLFSFLLKQYQFYPSLHGNQQMMDAEEAAIKILLERQQ